MGTIEPPIELQSLLAIRNIYPPCSDMCGGIIENTGAVYTWGGWKSQLQGPAV